MVNLTPTCISHESYGSLQESDQTNSSSRLALEDSLTSIPDASLVPFDDFAGEHVNWSQYVQGEASLSDTVATSASIQTALRSGSKRDGFLGVSHHTFRSRSSTRSGSSSNSSLPIEKLIASHRNLRWKGHNSAPTPIVNDESWASSRLGQHSAPAPIFTDPNSARFNFGTAEADPQNAAAEHLFYNSSSSIPLTAPFHTTSDATWASFQPDRTSPPAVSEPRGYEQISSMPTLPAAGPSRSYRDARLQQISGTGIAQDDAEVKVDGYRGLDQIQQHPGKRKEGDEVDPGSLGAFPGYSTDLTSHVAEQDNPRRLLWKNVLTGPCSKLKVGIVLLLVVVVALIIGLSLCLVHPASPSSNVREPCIVDEISRQCTTEGRIIDFPVCAQDRYDEVKAAFNQTLKTDMKMEKDSCDSANVALIRLAARMTGTESTRELANLSLLLDIVYVATFGPAWFKSHLWMSDQSHCFWQGVSCNSDSDVIELHLEQNNLVAGTLPTEIGLFPVLQLLSLAGNDIGNTVPSELGMLSSLIALDLHGNMIDGILPTEIGLLTVLQSLDMSSNNLGGTIPTSIGELSSLVKLYLDENSLTGAIPSEIERCGNLVVLLVGSNELSDAIPTQLGALRRVQVLDLENNLFSNSTIPSELGLLSNLLVLKMNGSYLKGTIPTELCSLESLNVLQLSSDTLTGTIPTEVGKLTELEVLNLNMNRLVGTLPTQHVGEMQRLTRLDVSYNTISGLLPTKLGRLSNLTTLLVLGTRLSGEVPLEVCSLGALTTLRLLPRQSANMHC